MKKLSIASLITALVLSFTFALSGCTFAAKHGVDTQNTDNSIPGDGAEEENFMLPTPDTTKSVFADLAYGSDECQKLDILLPSALEDIDEALPFFLLIHGGSWTGGDKEDFYFIQETLNLYGYAAVTINYRLLDEGITYLEMLDDIDEAIDYVKKVAPAYQLKTNKMGMMGSSAGAHLALLYSLKCGNVSSIPISLLVSLVGPADFTDPAYYQNSSLASTDYKLDLISSLLGATVTLDMVENEAYPDALYDASPITHVKEGAPATLLAYGGKDTLVPYTNGERLRDALAAIDASKVRLVIFPNSGHELNKDPAKYGETLLCLLELATKYLPS